MNIILGIGLLIAIHFVAQKVFGLTGEQASVMMLACSFLIYFFYRLFGYKVLNNRIYYTSPLSSSSFANFAKLTSGIKWTRPSKINSVENGVKIDEFKYDFSVSQHWNIFTGWFKKEKEVKVNAKALTRGSLVVGQMGAGKTEFLNPILAQDWYSRAIIHDPKGDFVQKFYNPKRDIILNPYDKRGTVWDIFEEAKEQPQIIETFFEILVKGFCGDKADFFSSSAQERFKKIFYKVYKQNLDSKESWQLFIDELKIYFAEVEKGNRKSENDIVSVMKLLMSFFEYQNFLIQKGKKTFTVTKYLKSTNSKIFLLNKSSYSKSLNPYFAGILSVFVSTFMKDIPEKTPEYTLFLLDEYLSFLPILDDTTKLTLHTLVRGRGGCLMPAVQYVPEDKKMQQQLLNSVNHLFIFQTADVTTTKLLNDLIGQVEYESIQKSNGSSGESYSQSSSKADLLSDDIIKGIGKDYAHITFIPDQKILYKGYSPVISLPNKYKDFEDGGDYKEFINSQDY